MKEDKLRGNKAVIIAFVIVGIIAVAGLYLMFIPAPVASDSTEELAICLTEKGIKMYGSIYCPHCTAQKELFGEAFPLVNYIECSNSENSILCAGLSGVPAWDIGGDIYYGKQELSKLKELSGC